MEIEADRVWAFRVALGLSRQAADREDVNRPEEPEGAIRRDIQFNGSLRVARARSATKFRRLEFASKRSGVFVPLELGVFRDAKHGQVARQLSQKLVACGHVLGRFILAISDNLVTLRRYLPEGPSLVEIVNFFAERAHASVVLLLDDRIFTVGDFRSAIFGRRRGRRRARRLLAQVASGKIRQSSCLQEIRRKCKGRARCY